MVLLFCGIISLMKLIDGFPRLRARFYKFNDNLSPHSVDSKTHKYVLVTYMPNTTKTRRLYAKIQAWKFPRIYFRVEYGIRKNDKGKNAMFYNDGYYTNKNEALKALTAFLE